MKNIIRKYFFNFVFFYRYIGYRIFIMVSLNMLVGILDGFGLAMFLPLLQFVDGTEAADPTKMGKLAFIVKGFSKAGLELNLVTVLIFLCFFFILKGLVKYMTSMYGVIVRQYFISRLRIQLLNGLNNISYKSFIKVDAGRIQNSLTGEATNVATAYNSYFKSLEQFVLVLVYMGFAFFVNVQFAILVMIGGLLTNILYNKIYKRTKKMSSRVTKGGHSLQRLMIQHVSHFKYLKGTGLLERFSQQIKTIINQLERDKRKIGFYGSLVTAMREPLLIIVVSLVILVQTKILGTELGPILISLLFFYRALSSLMTMQASWNTFLSVSGSTENMTSFLKEVGQMKEKIGKLSFSKFGKEIQLKNVYVAFDQKEVLQNISLRIKKNETVAFVGESGSGKSTLVNVIAGLIIPDKGDFQIDGRSFKELQLNKYQERIGFITQEPVIFTDNIYNNITFWDKSENDNRNKFWKAVQKASISTFIEELKEKENTILEHNGMNLSGGQRQRISIARELYKDIDLLIMDEATSALDSETEKSIQESIDALKGNYTIVIVAHRLSTIKNADKVVFLDQGKIVNIGTFTELVESNNSFRKMVESQELKT